MATPLTDAINALTTYANEVTGKSDTTLSDAIESLVDGYGGGGGISIDDIATNTQPSGAITLSQNVTRLGDYAFANKPITSIVAPGVTAFSSNSLTGTAITSLSDVNFPSLPDNYVLYLRMTSLVTFESNKILKLTSGWGALRDCTALKSVRIPNASADSTGAACFYGDSNLEIVDMGNSSPGNNCFYGCNKLGTIILRKSTVATLASNALSNAAKFKSGGSGGTIYIPKTLYDQLGTGTNDYKAATNWSTLDGYGTVTWAAIEGSEYELE